MSRRFFSQTAQPPRNNLGYYTKEFARHLFVDAPKWAFSSSEEEYPELFPDSEEVKLAKLDKKRNDVTTDGYVYTALPDPTESCKYIRVVKLLPGTRQDDIGCQLLQVELREELKYEALSYVWGDISETTPIQVDDRTLQIGESLRAALLDLRHPEKPRFLWADAICIDQNNIHERAKQVGIMGDIYTQAVRTVVWLGRAFEYVNLAFDSITTLANDALANQQSLIGNAETSTKSALDSAPNKEQRENLRHGCYILEDLVKADWWTRAWVVQEVCLASEKIIMCGQHEVAWKSFVTAVEFARLSDKFDFKIAGIAEDELDGFQSIIDMDNRLSEGNIAGQMLRLLTAMRPRLATNPRDKVFAIMGLLRGDRRDLGIVPDYTASVSDVYCTTATAIIRGTDSLDILSHCVDENEDEEDEELCLPSWIPDWSIADALCVPLVQNSFEELRHYNATPGSTASAKFYPEPDVVGVTGQLVDVIAEYSDLLVVPDDADWDYEEKEDPSLGRLLLEGGFELWKVYKLLLGVVDFFNVFLTWETVATSQPCYIYGTQDAQPSRKMFWQTLCTGLLDPEGEEKTEKMFEEWRAHLSPISGLRKMKATKFPNLFKTLGLMGYFWATWKSYGAFSEMIPHTRGRRIGRTKSGWLCLLPARVEVGDKMVLLKGATVPFVIRQRSDGYWQLVGEAYVHGIMNGEAYEADAGMLLKIK
ncbi:heterokaryon incompatibility protein-domain-containing protein [Paraphoma chrysanthemicola]|uniref:Heterokaryon incompatibility protein-domain-containing protein n=1 Tax=Paraphoma chrysanthemicola TaxID=798071 RepID=A0A8K0VYH1_9PLEO|nr:heterokaryon incompatibility protein-domain-containing protein [Paraphoma chrysanthemicola]